jgi:hypothetical protein
VRRSIGPGEHSVFSIGGPVYDGQMQDNAVRSRLIAEIPKRYNPWLHFMSTTGIGLVALILCAYKVKNPTFWEFLTIPILFFVANGAEWRAHKTLLHRRTFPFYPLYDQHTPKHHAIFQYDTMEIHSKRELYLVLIPSFGVLTIVISTVPFAYLCSRYISPNTGWLLLVASAIYVVTYELTHLSYHWPVNTRIGRLGLVKIMREHHRRHHHPKLMTLNYNVSFPLFDWIKGTIVTDEQLREAQSGKHA